MLGIVLISLLGIGATAALAIELFDDDNDDRPASDADDPETEASDDLISGSQDGDTLTGTYDGDPISAGPGQDIVRAGAGDDTVDGGEGDDRIFGEAGEDVLAGNTGDDFLRGGPDDDLILDSDGADTLRGDTGDDLIFATGVTDPTALLTADEDPAFVSAPSLTNLPGLDLTQDDDEDGDVVDGGRGSDIIFFGQGDTVTGGDGADLFVGGETLVAGAPALISDFEVNEETLVLTTNGGDEPTLDVTNDNGDAVLSLDGQIAVILAGVGADFTLADVELVDLTA